MADDDALLLQRQPGCDIGVMIQACDDHFVAGLPGAGKRPAEGEGQRGHVGAEHDLVGRGRIEEIGHGVCAQRRWSRPCGRT